MNNERYVSWLPGLIFAAFFTPIIVVGIFAQAVHAFGPVPKKDQCISVNAMIQRNCAPVYMCNGTKDTNASWCCSSRWADEEARLVQWHKRNCPSG